MVLLDLALTQQVGSPLLGRRRRPSREHFRAEPVDAPAAVARRELDAIDRGAVSYVAPYASSYEASRDVGSMSEYSTPGIGVELGRTR